MPGRAGTADGSGIVGAPEGACGPLAPEDTLHAVTRSLNPCYEAVRTARDFAGATLLRWGLGCLFDEVSLVASELVTNALRHALQLDEGGGGPTVRQPRPGSSPSDPERPPASDWKPELVGRPRVGGPPPICITLTHSAAQLVCAVTDPSSYGPVAKEPDHIAESGRGLHLVRSFSQRWGWQPLAGAGKVVWALFQTVEGTDLYHQP